MNNPMIKNEDINFEALAHPDDRFFKVFKFENSPDFWFKVNKFKRFLQEKYLYTSDEHRDTESIDRGVFNMFCGPHLDLYYEAGDFQGFIVFARIVPGHKADMIFKIWDKKLFSKDFVRACQKLAALIMDNLKLVRLTTHSADPKMVRLAEMSGFKSEGKSPYSMKWNGEYHTSHTLGLVREVSDD